MATNGPSDPASCHTSREIATQPECWRRAAALGASLAVEHGDGHGGGGGGGGGGLPRRGERVAVVGCGTSWFIAQCYTALREAGGHGETDAFAASEFRYGRRYDRLVAITRSGTTTEVLALLGRLRGALPTTVLTADPVTPVMRAADRAVVLDFADEESVVQTRFATSVLALLRAHLEHAGALPPGVRTVAEAAADAARAVAAPLDEGPLAADQITFLGTGWTYGLALEAGLKLREAAGAWTESYPAMEYRHGPLTVTGPGRVVWAFGALPDGLAETVAEGGGELVARSGPDGGIDPMADLIRAQRLAVAQAQARGADPDRPRNLNRSVIL